jgi:N-acyl-D-amino-acid deacylase
MRAGAFGMSTGLVYPPSCFGKTDEIIELCRVVARYGGLYASHIRGERETIVEAMKEALFIGERSGCRVEISHNCPKYGAWGRTKETLGLLEEGRMRGIEVTADNDVHTDLAPGLIDALPQYMHEMKTTEVLEHIKNPTNRERIKKDIIEDRVPAFGPSGLLKHGRFDRIFMMQVPGQRHLEGRTVEQIAMERGKDPFETYFDLMIEEENSIIALFDYISEKDIESLLVHPLVMIASDGVVSSENAPQRYFPCAFGEYPGILARYVRDKPLLTIEECVRKMTSFPAQKIGLLDRGLLRPGMRADIAVIDLPSVKDRATNKWPHKYPFENYPHRYPEGIPYVIVNGAIAIDNGEQTKIRAGEVLRYSV